MRKLSLFSSAWKGLIILVIYAKTDVNAGPKGITAFLVEKTFPGFSTAQKLW